jgi:hypothetical protein
MTGVDRRNVLGLCVVWGGLAALANPVGAFFLNDEWVYALAVRSILRTGVFALPAFSSSSLFCQAYWGALFCLPFGYSITALRISTLTLALMAGIGFYMLLRRLKSNEGFALCITLCLLLNPLFFCLANSFMTDVPYTAVSLLAICVLIPWLQTGERKWLIGGLCLALCSVLIRQFGILLLFALGLAYLYRWGATWRRAATAVGFVAAGVGANQLLQTWLRRTHRIPPIQLPQWVELSGTVHSARFLLHVLTELLTAAIYVGLFTFPLLALWVVSVWKSSGRDVRAVRWCLLVAIPTLCAACVVLCWRQGQALPFKGNILEPFGFGPLLLHDSYFLHRNRPPVPAPLQGIWLVLTALASLAVGAVAALFVSGVQRVASTIAIRAERSDHNAILVFLGIYSALYAFAITLFQSFDRYYLPLIPCVLLILVVHLTGDCDMRHPRWFHVMAVGGLIASGLFAVVGTHDLMTWSRARLAAEARLKALGVAPERIDGGYEFNGPIFYGRYVPRRRGTSWWWIVDDAYMIANGPVPGYAAVQRFPYHRWVTFQNAAIWVLVHRKGQ